MSESKLHIIRDTRDQNPLIFSEYDYIEVGVDKLDAGDYTIRCHDMPGDDYSVMIERKADCQELVTNLCKNWDRFLAEAELLSKYKVAQIVVCGPDNFEYLYTRGFTKLHPNFVYKQLTHLLCTYGISTTFLPDRASAESYIVRLFNNIRRITNDNE